MRNLRLPSHLRAVARTEGWLTVDEAQTLYDLARECSAGCIVEIGSYRGRSTVALGLGAQAGVDPAVYAIDPHEVAIGVCGGQFGPDDRGAFYRAMLKTGAYRNVRLVNLKSAVAAVGWTERVGLLWLDGDHTYAGVRRDFDAWRPHLTAQAAIAFHDADDRNLGPHQLIAELLAGGDYVQVRPGALTVLRRTA